MESRVELLGRLVSLQDNIEELQNKLSHYEWDSKDILLTVSVTDFTSVLKRVLDDKVDFGTLTEWANAIECRDDLDFADEEIDEIIFELANPEIDGEITKERLREIIIKFER